MLLVLHWTVAVSLIGCALFAELPALAASVAAEHAAVDATADAVVERVVEVDAQRDEDDATPAEGRGRALLIGCTEYPLLRERYPRIYADQIQLNGPANDVALVCEVLVTSLGFATGDVRVLAGWPDAEAERPTRARILEELDALAGNCGPGDFAVVYFAGHGSQQPTKRSDAEPDGLDEVLLPADVDRFDAGRGAIPGAITDDELGARLRAIRDAGAHVWLVVDACHSGSLLRGTGAMRQRGLEVELLGAPVRNVPRFRRQHGSEAPVDPTSEDFTDIVAFYGAQSYGRAPETEVPVSKDTARWHGLFTWLLSQELVRTRGQVTYDTLMGRVIAAYQAWPYRGTVPGALGVDLDRPVLGGGAGAREWLVTRTEAGLRLDRGILAGVRVGSRVALLGSDEAQLTEFEVERVGPFESFGRVVDEAVLGDETSWTASARSHPFDGVALRWTLVDAGGVELAFESLPSAVCEQLVEGERARRFPRVAPAQADWLVVLDGGALRLRPSEREGGGDLLLASIDELPRALERLARTRRLLALAADEAVAALPPELDVRVEVRMQGSRRGHRLNAGETVPPGNELRVVATKRGAGVFDVNLFYVDAHHGLTRLFPRRGNSARVGADVTGDLVVLDWTPLLDTSLGIEHVLAIVQERGAADPVLDLASLVQDGVATLRSSGQAAADPVASFLEDVARARPTRSGSDQLGDAPIAFALATFDVQWPSIAAPNWPVDARGRPMVVETGSEVSVPVEIRAVERLLPPEVPSPFEFGPSMAQQRVGRIQRLVHQPEVLLAGSADGVDRVLVDVSERRDASGVPANELEDPRLALSSGRFVPDAAFVFEPRGRFAFYRGRAATAFDLILLDADGDGDAETRWRIHKDGTWRRDEDVRLPWLSQSWLGTLSDAAARARARGVLAVLTTD